MELDVRMCFVVVVVVVFPPHDTYKLHWLLDAHAIIEPPNRRFMQIARGLDSFDSTRLVCASTLNMLRSANHLSRQFYKYLYSTCLSLLPHLAAVVV